MVSPHGRSHSNVYIVSKFMERDLHVDGMLAFSEVGGGFTVYTRIAAFINEARQIQPHITEVLLHQSVVVWASKLPANWSHVFPSSVLSR